MKEYQVWAEEVLQKVREKMEWVSEKIRIKSRIPQMQTAITMTARKKRSGLQTTV